jgi:nucleotide-binding universal stress UspA family protein
MTKHILVAVGPSFSEAALATAMHQTRECNGRLTILHIIDETPWWAGAFAESLCDAPALVNQLARVIRASCEKQLAHAQIRAEWQTRSLPRDGRSVPRVIADVALSLNVDLVVLGMHRHAWLATGTLRTRHALTARTNCEILIARECVKPQARIVEMPRVERLRNA